jgi:hypothetical protein
MMVPICIPNKLLRLDVNMAAVAHPSNPCTAYPSTLSYRAARHRLSTLSAPALCSLAVTSEASKAAGKRCHALHIHAALLVP